MGRKLLKTVQTITAFRNPLADPVGTRRRPPLVRGPQFENRWRTGRRRRRARVQIAVATLSDNSLRQTVHTHCASVHQAAKLVAALLRVAGVTAGLAESNGSLPPGL